MNIDNPTRRAAMAMLAALPLGAAGAAQTGAQSGTGAGARTLVVYFSRSGNTRVIAGVIQRTHGADLFEIRPQRAYPDDYFATVEQARQERDRRDQPALAAKVANIAQYDTVFLGFPIWGETLPPVLRSFLAAHDLAGKTVLPFITHGGYGVGRSETELAAGAPKARLQKAFVMEADQERRTTTEVQGWLGKIKQGAAT